MLLWLLQSLALTLMDKNLFYFADMNCDFTNHRGVPKGPKNLPANVPIIYEETKGLPNNSEDAKSRQTHFRLMTIAVSGVALTAPQVYILLRPSSSRYCSQPLLDYLICNIGFTVFTTAFSLILVLVDLVPRWLRGLFHTFGAASFIEGICTVLVTFLASDCAGSTPALYQMSIVLSVLNVLSIGFFLVVGPFWLSNSIFPGLVLNKQARTGICYESVACCPCFWHV